MALVLKNLPVNAGDPKDTGSTPGSGKSPGRGHGNPLQCLPGKSLAGYSPWGCKESDMTEHSTASDMDGPRDCHT